MNHYLGKSMEKYYICSFETLKLCRPLRLFYLEILACKLTYVCPRCNYCFMFSSSSHIKEFKQDNACLIFVKSIHIFLALLLFFRNKQDQKD